ncbi:hypothetical protein [Hoeflea ulvae]|uniref:Uncharacterized protein n=1 Tax=Hoeflea ulvae TaxID=2983764 RepID=A0ABT3YJ91_9HYPH|nr:hypothetical protein [Hoeflea ulvae]MCY0095961.1 hypothetical protein [Hoeflea ulvae]
MPELFPVSSSGAVSSPMPETAAVDTVAPLPVMAGSGKVTARIAPAVWPSPGAVDLVSQLLDLSETVITHTATNTAPESDSDFWDMLAAALSRQPRD